jgi:hypothetical protein
VDKNQQLLEDKLFESWEVLKFYVRMLFAYRKIRLHTYIQKNDKLITSGGSVLFILGLKA